MTPSRPAPSAIGWILAEAGAESPSRLDESSRSPWAEGSDRHQSGRHLTGKCALIWGALGVLLTGAPWSSASVRRLNPTPAPVPSVRRRLPGGRRSLAAGAICTNGAVFALRRHPGEQRFAARWPAASCADRRSAFPGGRCHLHEWRCLCPAASCRGSSDAPPAGLRPAVPTGGRRSPAAGSSARMASSGGAAMSASCAPRRQVGVRGGGAAMRRPLAVSLPCGLRPAVPTGGRRSPAAGALRTNGAVSTPRRHAAEQRCAARWPAASCAGPHRENCPEVGVPSRPRAFLAWWRTAERKKQWQRTPFAACVTGGKV